MSKQRNTDGQHTAPPAAPQPPAASADQPTPPAPEVDEIVNVDLERQGLTLVPLADGIVVGKVRYRHVWVRMLKTGDLLDATQAAERPHRGDRGEVVLVASPSLLNAGLVSRMVAKIGDDEDGPLTMRQLADVSARDYDVLLQFAELCGGATLREVAELGKRLFERSSG